jgi:dihydrodipicolinate synthase/N-acetylneuraminate lyase
MNLSRAEWEQMLGIVQYLKGADSDPYTIARLRMRLGEDAHLFYRHDNNSLGAFPFGATGWVSGTASFCLT